MMVVGTTTSSSFFCHLNLFYIYLQSTNIFRQNTTGGLVQQRLTAILPPKGSTAVSRDTLVEASEKSTEKKQSFKVNL